MTAKQKANNLIDSYYVLLDGFVTFEQVKTCALIAVDEMTEVYISAVVAMGMEKEIAEIMKSPYLEEVKQEIENL